MWRLELEGEAQKLEHGTRNYFEEHGFLAAYHRASRRTREVSLCRISAHIATVFLSRTTFGVSQLEKSTAVGGAQIVEKI